VTLVPVLFAAIGETGLNEQPPNGTVEDEQLPLHVGDALVILHL
jgi:hypothetical protein